MTTTKPTTTLTTKVIVRLRAMGHALSPVVQIGKDGLSDAVIAQTSNALTAHELIKVKLSSESPLDRHDAAAELAQRTNAVLVQVIGRVVLLFRESLQKNQKKKKSRIDPSTGLVTKKARPKASGTKRRTKKRA